MGAAFSIEREDFTLEEKKPKTSGMEKIAAFIVDKRNLFFLLYILALIFSVVASGWVKVENDITTYLPANTETRQGLTVMNDNFTTFGTARVMVSNVGYDTALALQDAIEEVEGVYSVDFDDTQDHYKQASALYSVTFDGTASDQVSITAVQGIRDALTGWDYYIDTEVGQDMSADLANEMGVILVIAAVIIVVVLTLTSRSYAEVPVLLLTFGAAAVLNMGTTFCAAPSLLSPTPLRSFCSWHWPLTMPSSCATASRTSTKPRIPGKPALQPWPKPFRRSVHPP